MPFKQGRLGFWVPPHLAPRHAPATKPEQEEPPAIIRFTVTTFGWLAMTGEVATIEDVAERIRRYSLQQTLGIVSWITIALNEAVEGVEKDSNLRRQVRIAERLLGSEGARALINIVRQREGAEFKPDSFALFHERQTLNALKLAFLIVDVDTPNPLSVNGVHFVEALLMLNDLIDPPEGSLGLGTEGEHEAMELYFSASTLFTESRSLLGDLVRAHYLYVEPRPEITVKGAVDVPAALERATGMDPETVWCSLFALLAFWVARTQVDLDAGHIAINRSAYLSNLPGLGDEERERWFRLAAWDARDVQRRIRRDYSLVDPRYWDVLPFEERPLIAFGDLLFCSSLPLLQRLPGGSLQHRLQDREVFTPHETRRFRDTRGYIVEHYTLDTLSRACADRFIPERELQNYAGGKSVCDAIIVYPDALILIECKTASPLLDTRHATNYEKYRQQWRRTMRKAATQFESTIALLRRGAFASLGLNASTRWDLFPVVAVFEQPVQPLNYRAIRDVDLAGHTLSAMMASGEVRPLQLLHIKEVEMWEMASEQGQSMLDLLREKSSHPATTELSFHHFIHLKGETFQNNHTRWQVSRWRDISDAAHAYFRELGLPSSGNESDEKFSD